MSRKIVIIGAGISGLTAAYWLHKAGMDVEVFEKDAVAGGTMRTLRDGGWLVETGPNSALETTPLFEEMFEGLGILSDRLNADERSSKRYILRNAKLHALPMSPGAFVTSTLWTAGGKLRLMKEPLVGRAEREETIAEFVERRLGREFLDYAINPFVAGVYAGNPEQLSVRAAFPKLHALEEKYGGLIKGMIKGAKERKRRAEKAKDRAKMFSFRHGMATFPDAIASKLGNNIRLRRDVQGVTLQRGFDIRWHDERGSHTTVADCVIVATPAAAAARMIAPVSAELSSALSRIYYPPVAEVFLGFHGRQIGRPLDGFGFLVPAKEQRKILGTIWSSALFPHRAPLDHVALTSFVGGSRQPELCELDDEALLNVVESELQTIMNIRGGPVYSKVIRWPKAIPQYHLGHLDIVRAMEKCEDENPGLFFCSNFRGGIAVGDCVMSGKKIADRILKVGDKRIAV